MDYKVRQTNAFLNDLDSVVEYIVFTLGNRSAAKTLLDAVEKCMDDLKRMPFIF